MLFANSNFKDLLVEGALFNLGIEIQCVSEHVWAGHGGFRGRGGEQPAGGIIASQGTFSSDEFKVSNFTNKWNEGLLKES